ncbi:Hypothetical predicted protein [Cloeon dipterum]|uniref:Tetratricopeptide repeat protein 17 n=2 Tax=Cloeon dipterum TaxID=197152 RepID=A0A8S1D691_9INSE|nr:Hypothetical predicted protein [Cloeon dipterum]
MLRILFISVPLALFFLEISATTHWIVTETGKIQSKDDTMFDMKNPDDLLGFLELEKKVASIENLTRLVAKRARFAEESDKIYFGENQPIECKKAIPIEDCNFYQSSSLITKESETLLQGYVESVDKFPECAALNFSLNFYEHLPAMQERLLLKMNPERAVLPTAKLDMFGKRVAAHLKANQTNWQLYNLATLFWRAKGEPVKAVNCIRQALLRSPSSYKHVTLLHLGNVFHQSKRSVEAAIILHAAIDHSSDEPESHWTLGNIYSVLGDYQRAIMCYKNALRLDKSLPIVEKNLLAVECHVSVNQALSEVMERLQELLSDLEDAKLLKQQRSRIESLVHKYKSITNIAERNFGTEVGNRIMDLDDRLKSLVDMVKTLSENMDFEKRVLTKLNPQEGECLFLEEIDAAVLYSSFEHRISDILNEGLNLKKGENHPLPWHPPMCEEDFRRKFPQIPNNVMNNFLSPGKSNKLKAQPSLMKHLREFVDAELEADEELGQRIHAALEKELGPRHLLRAFAGLYWYARGELRLATKCLLSSLLVCPEDESVIPLTAMSSMLMSMGLSEGALYLALRGIESNMSDVGCNVLLSSLYLLRDDLKNAKLHLQQAFLNRPHGHLRSVAHNIECHIRKLYHDKDFCESRVENGSDGDDYSSKPNLDQCIKVTKNK